MESEIKSIDCCGTCKYWAGWFDNMWCRLHQIYLKPYWLCDNFEKAEKITEPEPAIMDNEIIDND